MEVSGVSAEHTPDTAPQKRGCKSEAADQGALLKHAQHSLTVPEVSVWSPQLQCKFRLANWKAKTSL